ncbi:anthranilate synthase component II [Limnochorda pilosa]|uniref:Anthranilate synthase component II n=1 Tax=Limnochorda pilosa TaxID=1555112 RepID=A0A0K2SKG1_LIMPI|nr:aminodeoxychorismate/anthranilate synthase component II [Limnochorda pilosa]BAS27585.1 anthranilate synthase component II [Limnochorda pilosa]
MILVIDNYDSFTYNLVQLLGGMGADLAVVRNDRITAAQAEAMGPAAIILSPGPGGPGDAGVSLETVARLGPSTPILGVCLGHQVIGAAYGAQVVRAAALVHGKGSRIRHRGGGLYRGLPDPLEAGRYHSLVVSPEGLPDSLEVTAWTEDGLIMGLRHRVHPVEGVQFHPESILTRQGRRLLRNFLEDVGETRHRRGSVSGAGVEEAHQVTEERVNAR